MTFNMLFFTITFKKRTKTLEEYMNEERVDRLREKHIDAVYMHRKF